MKMSRATLFEMPPHRPKYFGCVAALLLLVVSPVTAATRPGAPRALSVEWPANGAASGPATGDAISVSNVRFTPLSFKPAGFRRSGGAPLVIFTRQSNGTRNLWIATPKPSASSNFDWTARGVLWTARPLTQLQAPFWIDEACPLDDGKTLLCVTNAVPAAGDSPASVASGKSQIARLDVSSGRWEALTNNASISHSPSLSPDGRRFAFVSDRSGFDAVYVMAVGGGIAQIAATWARRPCWLDNQTLLFQNARGDRPGLFRVALPRLRDTEQDENTVRPLPKMLLANAIEATVSPDGQSVCAVLETMPETPRGQRANAPAPATATASRLVMMAADGSGARALAETAGARRPGFAPDGSAILFDAPQNNPTPNAMQSTLPSPARGLWSLPMLRVAPVAVLQRVRTVPSIGIGSTPGTLEILGTAFSAEAGPLRVRVEIGSGEAPDQWTTLATRTTPVQSGRLALWQPPTTRGEWTLRLTVVDAAGDSVQSTLPVVLPMPTGRETFLLPPDFGPTDADNAIPVVPPANALGGPLTPNPVAPVAPGINTPTEPALRGPLVQRPPTPAPTTPTTPTATRPLPTTTRPPRSSTKPLPVKSAASSPRRGAAASGANTTNTTPARRGQGATYGGTLPYLPLPALPPPPAPKPTPALPEGFPTAAMQTPPQPSASTSSPSSRRPSPDVVAPTPRPTPAVPVPVLRAPEAGAAEPSPPPLPAFPSVNARRANAGGPSTRKAVAPSTSQSTAARRDSDVDDTVAPDLPSNQGKSGDAAQLQVIGAPATMMAGERTTMTITLRNVGTTAWASAGERPVRAFVRWVDNRSGYRRRWAYQWLRANVAPGGTSKLSFTLTAPPQAGRYQLSFALIRLPQDGPSIAPPATDREAQRRWPGEFGTIAFNVSVRGNASDER